MGKPGPETRLVNRMTKRAKKIYGHRLVIVNHHGGMYSATGVSDLLCCLDGVFVACEVKAPESYGNSVQRALDEGPTLKQRLFVGHVIASGGVAGFAATEEQFLALLEEAEGRVEQEPEFLETEG